MTHSHSKNRLAKIVEEGFVGPALLEESCPNFNEVVSVREGWLLGQVEGLARLDDARNHCREVVFSEEVKGKFYHSAAQVILFFRIIKARIILHNHIRIFLTV